MGTDKKKRFFIMFFLLVTVVLSNCYLVSSSIQQHIPIAPSSEVQTDSFLVVKEEAANIDTVLTVVTRGIGDVLLRHCANIEQIQHIGTNPNLRYLLFSDINMIPVMPVFLWILFFSISLIHSKSCKILRYIHNKDGKKRILS